jgi:Uma2 family endonuclease
MSTRGTLIDDVAAGRAPALLPLSVAQFHQMLEAGILTDGEPVELIEGMLVRKDRGVAGRGQMVHGPHHALVVARLQRLSAQVERFGCHARSQLPITLSDVDEPEPDLAIVSGAPDDYADRHPGPDEVIAVVEVADSSLVFDRTTKQRLYASAGIGTYWIVNLSDDCLEVLESPDREERRYTRRRDIGREATAHLVLAGGVLEIGASSILPPNRP